MQSSEETLSPQTSVCSRVPVDILHEILPYCMPKYPTIQSANHVVSTLSQVSSTWRAAVLSSPRLRSRLLVTIRRKDDLRRCAQTVTQWFQHTNTLPLSFFLNIDFEARYVEDTTRIRTFLKDLSPIMLRVRHFALHSRLTTQLLPSFASLEWELPQLKILDLFSHEYLDEDDAIAYSVPIFHNAPNLIQVTLGNAITWAERVVHLLPWPHLTHINLKYETAISRWIEIMNMCPKMRFCAAKIAFDDYSPSCPPNGIHHTLETLILDFADGSIPFLKFLSLYQLPSLYCLNIHYHEEPNFDCPCPQGIPALAHLRYFSINRGNILPRKYVTHLVEVLREMVKLVTLELQQTTPEFIPLYEALSFNRPEEALLPRLSTLKLWVSPVSQEKDKELQPLLGMLSSRSRESTIPVGFDPLRRLIVSAATEDIYERMRNLFDPWIGGLALRFSITLQRGSLTLLPEGWTQHISDY